MHTIKLLAFLLAICSLNDVIAGESVSLAVCYNFGCKTKEYVMLTRADIDTLQVYFMNTNSAKHEREQIGHAIAELERIVAHSLPTRNDIGGNYKVGMIENGQLDCIDESTNTTNYLIFIEAQGWLKFHSVQDKVKRAPFLVDDHWTAVIQVEATGQLYAVDSWFFDNGKLPVIQKLEDWYKDIPVQLSE